MDSAIEEARAAIAKAQAEYTQYYNRRRTKAPVFKKGDFVYLDASDIKTTHPSKKLDSLRYGPFEVLEKVGPSAYKLKLPWSMRLLHPVFPVVKLTPCPPESFPGQRQPAPPPPIVIEGEEEYEVDAILDSRIWRNKLQYLVHWKGYDDSENQWVNTTDIRADSAIGDYHRAHPE